MVTINDRSFDILPVTTLLRQTWEQKELSSGFQEVLITLVSQLWPENSKELSKDSLFALPAICNEALGGSYEGVAGINACWDLVYLILHILDIIEDNDVDDPVFNLFSPSVLNNAATALIFSIEAIFDRFVEISSIPLVRTVSIRNRFHKTILKMCEGQHFDLTLKQTSLEGTWRIVEAKSGVFFGLGCFAGAQSASDDPKLISALEIYGYHLGLIIQILDDLKDLEDSDNNQNDLRGEKCSLPIAYAYHVLPTQDRERLQQHISEAKISKKSERIAREIIFGCGARIYLQIEAQKHRNIAEAALQSIPINPHCRDILIKHLCSNKGNAEKDG